MQQVCFSDIAIFVLKGTLDLVFLSLLPVVGLAAYTLHIADTW